MKRDRMISNIQNQNEIWDFIIIGGGATGVGTALDAASRGYKTLLLEQSDFGKGTSSKSTKLVHGGVRYLQQGNLSLVLEALKERGILRRNAPHLVHDLPFIVPVYDWWEGPFYGIGLRLYDMLAGKEGFGHSKNLSKEETIKHIPTIKQKGLKGGVIYHDGQFDDARLIINLVETASEQGATLINYMQVTSLLKKDNLVCGVDVIDLETNKRYLLKAKSIINATGVFSDNIRKMDDDAAKNIITSSQGIHIVLNKSFLPGDSAIMIPATDDGRVIFAIPWENTTLIGTTDTPIEKYSLEPEAQKEEIDFLLKHIARYLSKSPKRSDILSVFAGLRPLVKNGDTENTAAISREYTINISRSGLVSISGGKWTTYRKMGEETIEHALVLAQLDYVQSNTKNLQIHGYHEHIEKFNNLDFYGSDASAILKLIKEKQSYNNILHPKFTTIEGEVIWSVRHEMAITVEDFLSRRTRLLLKNTKVSIEIAPKIAQLMASELQKDEKWIKNQIHEYTQLAKKYIAESTAYFEK